MISKVFSFVQLTKFYNKIKLQDNDWFYPASKLVNFKNGHPNKPSST